jgi:hypothetical protein
MKTAPSTTGTVYHANGRKEQVRPANRLYFTAKELQRMVGGSYISDVFLHNGYVMIINAEARQDGLPVNVRATEIIRRNDCYDTIAGDVLVCPSKLIK